MISTSRPDGNDLTITLKGRGPVTVQRVVINARLGTPGCDTHYQNGKPTPDFNEAQRSGWMGFTAARPLMTGDVANMHWAEGSCGQDLAEVDMLTDRGELDVEMKRIRPWDRHEF